LATALIAAQVPETWDGDRTAYQADKGRLVAFFRARGLSPAESEDLADETVLRTLIHLKRHGRTQEHLGPLTKTIARNLLIERRRKTSTVTVVPLAEHHEVPDETLDPYERAAESERREAVRNAVRTLSPRNRRVVTMWMAGKSPGEIARELGIKRNAVDAILHRAKRGLASRLGPRTLWGLAGLAVLRVRTGVRDGFRLASSYMSSSTAASDAAMSLAAVAVAAAISAASSGSAPVAPPMPTADVSTPGAAVDARGDAASAVDTSRVDAPGREDAAVPPAQRLEKQSEVSTGGEIVNPTTGEEDDWGIDAWLDYNPDRPTDLDRLWEESGMGKVVR
jgi:RNA polymerase sigma factor (sigma-70 family)